MVSLKYPKKVYTIARGISYLLDIPIEIDTSIKNYHDGKRKVYRFIYAKDYDVWCCYSEIGIENATVLECCCAIAKGIYNQIKDKGISK